MLGDDAAYRKGDQDDDGHAAQDDEFHLMDEARGAKMASPGENATDRHHDFAEKAQCADNVASGTGYAVADIDQELGRIMIAPWRNVL